MFYIYIILNKVNGKTYIGKSNSKNLRINYHKSFLNRNKHPNPHLQAAWVFYGKDAFEFYIFDEYTSEQELNNTEISLISWYKKLNLSYNIKVGGEGGPHSEETKEKISKANLGKIPPNKGIPVSKEQLEIMTQRSREYYKTHCSPMKGKTHTEEAKAKIREARAKQEGPWKGKNRSEDTKKKISESQKGRKQPQETILKRMEAMKGYKHSEETRNKISLALKGKPKSPEHIAKLPQNQKRKTNSNEQ